MNECEPLLRGLLLGFRRPRTWETAAARTTLGAFFVNCEPRAGVAQDAARGFELVRQAFAQGFTPALYQVADRGLHSSTILLNLSCLSH